MKIIVRFKIKAIKPALVIKLIILSHSSTQIDIKTIKNNITDSLWINKVLDIIKSDITITPLHRILLSFNISKKIDLFNIDFLIISAEKEGNEYPVGTAHVDNADYNIKFLDITNEDFYGRINYFVKPVFEDAEIGNRVYLGTVNLLTKIHIID